MKMSITQQFFRYAGPLTMAGVTFVAAIGPSLAFASKGPTSIADIHTVDIDKSKTILKSDVDIRNGAKSNSSNIFDQQINGGSPKLTTGPTSQKADQTANPTQINDGDTFDTRVSIAPQTVTSSSAVIYGSTGCNAVINRALTVNGGWLLSFLGLSGSEGRQYTKALSCVLNDYILEQNAKNNDLRRLSAEQKMELFMKLALKAYDQMLEQEASASAQFHEHASRYKDSHPMHKRSIGAHRLTAPDVKHWDIAEMLAKKILKKKGVKSPKEAQIYEVVLIGIPEDKIPPTDIEAKRMVDEAAMASLETRVKMAFAIMQEQFIPAFDEAVKQAIREQEDLTLPSAQSAKNLVGLNNFIDLQREDPEIDTGLAGLSREQVLEQKEEWERRFDLMQLSDEELTQKITDKKTGMSEAALKGFTDGQKDDLRRLLGEDIAELQELKALSPEKRALRAKLLEIDIKESESLLTKNPRDGYDWSESGQDETLYEGSLMTGP